MHQTNTPPPSTYQASHSPEELVRHFFSSYQIDEHTSHTVLIRSGEYLPELFYLEEGFVAVRSTSAEGQELFLHMFGAGSCFSLIDIEHGFHHYHDYVTVTPVRLRRAPAEKVMSELLAKPEVQQYFLHRTLRGLNQLMQRIQQTAFGSARERVIGLLVFFARHFGSKSEKGLQLTEHLTHHTIASWLGLSRENVTLQLRSLEKEGLIKQEHRKILITDEKKLLALSRAQVPHLQGF